MNWSFCAEWIERVRNACGQSGRDVRQELINKSEMMVQNFINSQEPMDIDDLIQKILNVLLGHTNPSTCSGKAKTNQTKRSWTGSKIQPEIQNLFRKSRRGSSRQCDIQTPNRDVPRCTRGTSNPPHMAKHLLQNQTCTKDIRGSPEESRGRLHERNIH